MPMPDLPRGTSQTSETRHRVSDNVYDTWLTKQEAAERIGGSTKMVERLAAEGKIQQASTQREGRGAFRTVYHPDDVARIARERQPGAVSFVLPVGVTPPSNGNGHAASTALRIADPAADDQVASFFCSLVAAIRTVSETSETRVALFVSIPEAAQVSGLSRAYLKRGVANGSIPAVKDGRTWRIRRKDLEAL
jgi:excisionase family DNA binding protein